MPVSPFFLTKTVALQRFATTQDAAGAAVKAPATVTGYGEVPAAVQPASARDLRLFAGRQVEVTHAVYTETALPFLRGDRLLVSDGTVLAVEGLLDAAGAGRLYKLACRRLLA